MSITDYWLGHGTGERSGGVNNRDWEKGAN